MQAPQLSGTALLAAALLSVCQGGGGHGVDADPPTATWHEDTQGPTRHPTGHWHDGSDVAGETSLWGGTFQQCRR